jgi:hypothetical protein
MLTRVNHYNVAGKIRKSEGGHEEHQEITEVVMSSFAVTIVVPHTENETVFPMHVVPAALKAYRDHRQSSEHVNGNGSATNDSERMTLAFGRKTAQ